MKSFTEDQINFICDRIDVWYEIWNEKSNYIQIERGKEMLNAKEMLKSEVCGKGRNLFVEVEDYSVLLIKKGNKEREDY